MRHFLRPALIAGLCFLALPAVATAKSGGFQSPSKNIGCYIDSSAVRCDIRVHSWTAPPKPSYCDVDWGGGMAVGKKHRGGFVCAGDTTLNAGPVLAYGSSRSEGRFTCTSRESGMTCRNRRNGHGFFLSRDSYRRF